MFGWRGRNKQHEQAEGLSDFEIPPLLSKLVGFLLEKGCTDKEIFKAPESHRESVIAVSKKINETPVNHLQLSEITGSPLVVGELLKHYLMNLHEPLLSFDLYDSFLLSQTILDTNDRLMAYRTLLNSLPKSTRLSARSVLSLLSTLVNSTKMFPDELVSRLSFSILRAYQPLFYTLDDAPLVLSTLADIISNWEAISRTQVSGHRVALTNRQKPCQFFEAVPYAAAAQNQPLLSAATPSRRQSQELTKKRRYSASGAAMMAQHRQAEGGASRDTPGDEDVDKPIDHSEQHQEHDSGSGAAMMTQRRQREGGASRDTPGDEDLDNPVDHSEQHHEHDSGSGTAMMDEHRQAEGGASGDTPGDEDVDNPIHHSEQHQEHQDQDAPEMASHRANSPETSLEDAFKEELVPSLPQEEMISGDDVEVDEDVESGHIGSASKVPSYPSASEDEDVSVTQDGVASEVADGNL